MKSLRKTTGRVEFYIGLVFVALCLLIQIRSGQFFTSNNIVDILSAMVVPGIFAIGEFMVIVSGGFDVSFPALASLSAFATTKLFLDMNYEGGVLLPLLVGLLAWRQYDVLAEALLPLYLTEKAPDWLRSVFYGALTAAAVLLSMLPGLWTILLSRKPPKQD